MPQSLPVDSGTKAFDVSTSLQFPSSIRRVMRSRIGARLAGWLPVVLTLLIGGGSSWAIIALHRSADRIGEAQVTLAEIQRNVQNADALFSGQRPDPPPGAPPGAPPPPPQPPPGGLSSASLQADDLTRLAALRSNLADRQEIDAVSRGLMALNTALGPPPGPGGPEAGFLHGRQVARTLQSALTRLSRSVAVQRHRAVAVADVGTLVIALLAAFTVAVMLRRLDRRRRREAAKHADELRALALLDPLTGLANRRQLSEDLSAATRRASEQHPVRLLLFDLDGFKNYNDTFGHHEGDLLLGRLAKTLSDAVASSGRAYRLGGDEFCALISLADEGGELERSLQQSLSSDGEGFSISASAGSVLMPAETSDPETAMQWADARMYENKQSGRLSAGQQSRNVALRLLAVREPEVYEHSARVAALAGAIAEQLGFSARAMSILTRAAELHDVGKVAIPFSILEKPGPLNGEEWKLMRRHPIIGANILNAAPALAPVAEIVHAAHERFDGTGYPNGIGGEDIPLASRIVFVCDAFDAMTSDRAYRKALSERQALAEIRRAAGTQFDPEVVDVLERLLRDGVHEPAGRAASSANRAQGAGSFAAGLARA
jgi:diguanylate cyclase (GGDEF)-like protein/putative nucleotidyltransferase with HDIG domain